MRRLGPSDAAVVLRSEHLFDEPLDGGAVRAYLRDRRNVFLLAVEGIRGVGFLRGTELRQLASPRRQMFLYEIAVEPNRRRRGVGRALVNALLAECGRRRFEEVFVFTDDPRNRAAAGLYRATGAVTETRGERMYVYTLPRQRRRRP